MIDQLADRAGRAQPSTVKQPAPAPPRSTPLRGAVSRRGSQRTRSCATPARGAGGCPRRRCSTPRWTCAVSSAGGDRRGCASSRCRRCFVDALRRARPARLPVRAVRGRMVRVGRRRRRDRLDRGASAGHRASRSSPPARPTPASTTPCCARARRHPRRRSARSFRTWLDGKLAAGVPPDALPPSIRRPARPLRRTRVRAGRCRPLGALLTSATPRYTEVSYRLPAVRRARRRCATPTRERTLHDCDEAPTSTPSGSADGTWEQLTWTSRNSRTRSSRPTRCSPTRTSTTCSSTSTSRPGSPEPTSSASASPAVSRPTFDHAGRIHLSKGCGVTSQGYLIVEPAGLTLTARAVVHAPGPATSRSSSRAPTRLSSTTSGSSSPTTTSPAP